MLNLVQYEIWTHKRHLPNSKIHGANMGPIWDWQGPGGPHVGPMNFAIWANVMHTRVSYAMSIVMKTSCVIMWKYSTCHNKNIVCQKFPYLFITQKYTNSSSYNNPKIFWNNMVNTFYTALIPVATLTPHQYIATHGQTNTRYNAN